MLLLVSAGALEPPASDPRILPLMERSAVLPSGVLAACHAGTSWSSFQERVEEFKSERMDETKLSRATQKKDISGARASFKSIQLTRMRDASFKSISLTRLKDWKFLVQFNPHIRVYTLSRLLKMQTASTKRNKRKTPTPFSPSVIENIKQSSWNNSSTNAHVDCQ